MYVRPAQPVGDIENDLGCNTCYTPKTRLTSKRLNVIALFMTSLIWASSRENLSSVVCDQVRLKPVCSATETSKRLETLGLATVGIILSKEWTNKLLTRLCGCTVWSEPLLITYCINRFSHEVAHLIPNMVTFMKFNPNWPFSGVVQDWRSMCVLFFRHSWSAIFHFHHSHCNKTRTVYR